MQVHLLPRNFAREPPWAQQSSEAAKKNKTGRDYNVNRALLQGPKLLNKNILGNNKA